MTRQAPATISSPSFASMATVPGDLLGRRSFYDRRVNKASTTGFFDQSTWHE